MTVSLSKQERQFMPLTEAPHGTHSHSFKCAPRAKSAHRRLWQICCKQTVMIPLLGWHGSEVHADDGDEVIVLRGDSDQDQVFSHARNLHASFGHTNGLCQTVLQRKSHTDPRRALPHNQYEQ